jgi:hypothetical protein
MEAVWAELTCNHTIVQKKILPFGYVGNAIKVALMPAEAYIREKTPPGGWPPSLMRAGGNQ